MTPIYFHYIFMMHYMGCMYLYDSESYINQIPTPERNWSILFADETTLLDEDKMLFVPINKVGGYVDGEPECKHTWKNGEYVRND